ncbi:MAG: hypothetical protein HZA48_03930 [Planctomycetes bacterium]|nr:hypothetical protein [Planctomycetota bacterium]
MKKIFLLFFFMVVAGLTARAQSLTVQAGDYNPLISNELTGAQKVPLLQIEFTASQASFTVTSLSFRASGSIDESIDVYAVYLYEDINGNGLLDVAEQQAASSVYFSSDNSTAVFSGFYLTVPAFYPVNLILAADFTGTATVGENVIFSIEDYLSITAVQGGTSTSAVIDGTFPINSNAKTISTVGTLSATKSRKSPGDQQALNDVDGFIMLELTLTPSSCEPVQIQSITVSTDGTADESVSVLVSGVRLYYDSDYDGAFSVNDQSANPYGMGFSGDDAAVTFLGPFTEIPANSTVYLMVVYDLSGYGLDGETLNAKIASSTHISAKGAYSNQFIQVVGPPVSGNTVTISPPTPPPAEVVKPEIRQYCFVNRLSGPAEVLYGIWLFLTAGILAVISFATRT